LKDSWSGTAVGHNLATAAPIPSNVHLFVIVLPKPAHP
jgi:hypothetical protein